jgi:hypothetical protein
MFVARSPHPNGWRCCWNSACGALGAAVEETAAPAMRAINRGDPVVSTV